MMLRTLWSVLLMCGATLAQAHEVHHRIEASGAVLVTLNYANGEPFAYEKYALYPAGQDIPQQVGNTDAQGRIAFVPGATSQWRLQASSADGHGVNLEFAAPVVAAPMVATGAGSATTDIAAPRWLLAGFGLSMIFGLFGLLQLFTRKKT
jgi:nickel transport protein